jgi:hypothetical protein
MEYLMLLQNGRDLAERIRCITMRRSKRKFMDPAGDDLHLSGLQPFFVPLANGFEERPLYP